MYQKANCADKRSVFDLSLVITPLTAKGSKAESLLSALDFQ